MKEKFRFFMKSLIVISLVLLGVLTYDIYHTFIDDNVNPDNPSGGVVKIEREADYEQVCRILVSSGVLKDPDAFLRTAKAYRLNTKFHPGYYVFTPGMNNREIVRTLAFGLQKPVNIVIPDCVRNAEELASVISRQVDCDSASVLSGLKDSTLAASYGLSPENFLTMFIPNTYEVYWTITPDNLFTRLYREYEKFWKNGREEKAAEIGLSRSEVSILASIVSEETQASDEMPVIAGVYMNRLQKDMLLQADPTVKFAAGDSVKGRIKYSHLEIDSPYNTYKYPGLPPGPIVIPSIRAIDAVLNYSHHNYIYFCARPTFDGRHNFAANYSEHARNAELYHAALEEYLKRKQAEADSLAALKADTTSFQEVQSPESPLPSPEPKQ